MAGFPKLIPAFTAHIHILPPTQVGALSTGPHLLHVPFVPDSGYIKSEPDYPIKLDAIIVHGADYIKIDGSGKYARLEVQSTIRAAEGYLRYCYTGTVDLSRPAGKVLRGEADAATTNFGDVFAHPRFETGVPAFQALENKTFVGSGRFILEEGKPTVVEYKISEVVN